MFVTTKHVFCHDKSMPVETKLLLPGQTRVCCDKTFVATKMILVAAPANDNIGCVPKGGVERITMGLSLTRRLLD